MLPKHCRICYQPDNDDLISVRLKQDAISIEKMILAITGISVTSDRRLPQNICLDCMDRLKVAYELREQCIRTNDWLCEELSKADETIKCKEEAIDAASLELDNGEEKVQNSMSFEELEEMESEHELSKEQEQPACSEGVFHDGVNNSDILQENDTVESVEEPKAEAYSLQELEIEFDNGEAVPNEEYLLSEDEGSLEMKESTEATADSELDDPDDQYDEEWEPQATANSARNPQTKKIQRVICRISESNLQILSTHQGYSIVELRPYRCCCCAELFNTEQELNEHLKRRAEKNEPIDRSVRYVCEYCGKQFKVRLVYLCHKRLREQRQFYQCRLCHVLLDSATRMVSHMLMSEEHASYFDLSRESIAERYTTIALTGARCCCCKRYFEDNEKLLEHVVLEHRPGTHGAGGKLPYGCELCERKFRSKERLDEHLQYTVDVKQHYCNECSFQTYNPRRMELHLYSGIHRNSGTQVAVELKPLENNLTEDSYTLRFCCFKLCEKSFLDQSTLQAHIEQMHREALELHKLQAERISKTAKKDTRYQCERCCLMFISLTALEKHQTIPQPSRQEHVCPVCGISKRTRTELVAHERVHTGERPFPCDQCDKAFASKKTLSSHQSSCHQPRQHSCGQCDASFSRKENLTRHIAFRHGEATIPCEVCGKKFKALASLNIHKVSHTGEKRYQCRMEGCDKRYGTVTDRRRHEMSVHTQERPHQCAYCNATFVRKRQLTVHERRHTGEKPYMCTVCGQHFIIGYLMRQHMRNGCSTAGKPGKADPTDWR